jgi:hypothetical protein
VPLTIRSALARMALVSRHSSRLVVAAALLDATPAKARDP